MPDDKQESAPSEPTPIGSRIRMFREEQGLGLNQLAQAANLSKGYLSSLENDPNVRRPSAEALYQIARVLGVTISDLLGRPLLPAARSEVPASLRKLAEEDDLPEADVLMLATIQFRGEAPATTERWRYIYQAIRSSRDLDHRGTNTRPKRRE